MPHFQGSEAQIWYEQVGNPGGKQLVWVGGGGTMGRDWHRFQTPHFAGEFQNLVFDNRGIGDTRCDAPMPWGIERFAHDLAELIAGVCEGPAILIGTSLGSASPLRGSAGDAFASASASRQASSRCSRPFTVENPSDPPLNTRTPICENACVSRAPKSTPSVMNPSVIVMICGASLAGNVCTHCAGTTWRI